jgi:hypothetical protein
MYDSMCYDITSRYSLVATHDLLRDVMKCLYFGHKLLQRFQGHPKPHPHLSFPTLYPHPPWTVDTHSRYPPDQKSDTLEKISRVYGFLAGPYSVGYPRG